MSVRFLTARLYPLALLLAALPTLTISVRAGDDVDCPKCKEGPRPAAVKTAGGEKLEMRSYSVADLVIPCGNGSTVMPAPTACPQPATSAHATTVAPYPIVLSGTLECKSSEIVVTGNVQCKSKDVACSSNVYQAATPKAATMPCCPPTQTTEAQLISLLVHSVAPDS